MSSKHRLRAERDLRGLTQKALGAQAGVSPSTISHIECHRGPDVDKDQLRRTKTKLATAVKIMAALLLSDLPVGEYDLAEFVALQKVFTEAEIYEALVNQLEREQTRQRRKRERAAAKRHLQLVS